MIRMEPGFIEQAQGHLDLLLRDCRAYMRKYRPFEWRKSCHHIPCEAVAYGNGEDECEMRTNEMKFLGKLLKGSGTRKKPGKSQYIPRTQGWKSPKVKVYPP